MYKISFDFALTSYCQSRCKTCPRTNRETGEPEDWLVIRHVPFDKFKKNTLGFTKEIEFIKFCGATGDPMMHPEITKFVDHALTLTDNVRISTNGGIRNEKWYTDMGNKYGNKLQIVFAIDGIDHETNWKYREGVDFERAMNNMKAYIEADGIGIWWFIIFEWNWHQIPQARKMADELGIDIEFKFNQRNHGLISNKSKLKAQRLLNEQV